MNIPSFSRPSCGEVITMREATAADAIDFSGIAPGHDHEVTTLFLNRVQLADKRSDAALWTGEDRLLGLFWYWLHTESDLELAINYDCEYCGDKHHYLQDGRALAEGYAALSTPAEREGVIDGRRIIVRPLIGKTLEMLEVRQLEISALRSRKHPDEVAIRRMEADLRLMVLGEKFSFPDDPDTSPSVYVALRSMPMSMVRRYQETIETLYSEMAHGLKGNITPGGSNLILPHHQCPKSKNREDVTLLRVPFRVEEYIPGI